MNHEEISEHILAELECSLEELESLENRKQLERQGIDVQNDIERYSALIDSFKLMVEKAKAFDLICEAMDYHYPTVSDRKYLNGYQHPKASLKDIDAIINSYESGESDV